MLRVMEEGVGVAGYVPDLSQAPMVPTEEQKGEKRRHLLRLHSKRLAIAFGLLDRAAVGSAICVFKNLCVCRDCHAMTKLLTLAFGVEIVVRDHTMFHHFRRGCGCIGGWEEGEATEGIELSGGRPRVIHRRSHPLRAASGDGWRGGHHRLGEEETGRERIEKGGLWRDRHGALYCLLPPLRPRALLRRFFPARRWSGWGRGRGMKLLRN